MMLMFEVVIKHLGAHTRYHLNVPGLRFDWWYTISHPLFLLLLAFLHVLSVRRVCAGHFS